MQPENKPADDKDITRRIWTNCPACARKHLSAAYALTSGNQPAYGPPDSSVLLARAYIAIVEWATGYLGNRALAIGCLAAAETAHDIPVHRIYDARELRLAIERGGTAEEAIFRFRVSFSPSNASLASAHLIEADRELPGATGDLPPGTFEAGDFEPLVDTIRRVETDYELGANANGTP